MELCWSSSVLGHALFSLECVDGLAVFLGMPSSVWNCVDGLAVFLGMPSSVWNCVGLAVFLGMPSSVWNRVDGLAVFLGMPSSVWNCVDGLAVSSRALSRRFKVVLAGLPRLSEPCG